MDEEQEQTKPAEDTGKGNKSESTSLIESADKAAERLEQANKVKEELLAREEALEARRKLGGGSQAGIETPQLSEAEKKKKGALEFFEGSSIADAIKKYG